MCQHKTFKKNSHSSVECDQRADARTDLGKAAPDRGRACFHRAGKVETTNANIKIGAINFVTMLLHFARVLEMLEVR